MKTKYLLLLILMSLNGRIALAQLRFKEFDVTSPVSVHMPVQSDSTNFKGGKYGISDLLKTQISMNFDELAHSRMIVDSSGFVRVPRIEEGAAFYLFSTNIRATRFMHATLKVSSSARFEVYVDGDMKQSRTSVPDTVSKITPASVSLRMEPQKDYRVVVKMMVMYDDKVEPMLKCELENDSKYKDVECLAGADLKRRLSMFETTYGDKVNLLSLSPDGKYLLMGSTKSYSVKSSVSTIVLKEVKDMKTIMVNVPSSARWMPRSSRLYYTVKGEKRRDLLMLDPKTLTTTTIKRDIPDGTFHWSPTEEYLIYNQVDINLKESGSLRRYIMPDDRIPGARNRNYIMKYDLRSGLTERLTFGLRSTRANDVTSDGRKILYTSSTPNITERPFNLYSLIELDLVTMKTDTLIRGEKFLKEAYYSPDASQILLIASPNAFDGIGRNCGVHPIANDYDSQAFLMDRESLSITPITRDFNPSVEFLQWNYTDRCIYFSTVDEDCRNIYRYVPDKNEFEMLPLREDVIGSFSLPQFAPTLAAYVGGGSTSVGVAYTYNMKKKTSVLLADPMGEYLKDFELGSMKEWNFISRDGTKIKGMICLPPDFDDSRKYPLIVYYYGGTTPTIRTLTSPYSPQLFASRDYIVYVVQPSGTIGFGQEFSARHVNAWGKWTADDIIEGTQKLYREHTYIDSTKVGCLGASYGGFMTQYLQTKTDMFAAAVSHAGISNITSYWGEGYWGYSYNGIAAADSYPWNNPDLFTENSSLFNAEKIHTPLLLLHGTIDKNVPIGESIQLFNALKILGKPVELITVDGEDHYVADYSLRLSWQNTIMAWFAKWLQDSPQWWNELYPDRKW